MFIPAPQTASIVGKESQIACTVLWVVIQADTEYPGNNEVSKLPNFSKNVPKDILGLNHWQGHFRLEELKITRGSQAAKIQSPDIPKGSAVIYNILVGNDRKRGIVISNRFKRELHVVLQKRRNEMKKCFWHITNVGLFLPLRAALPLIDEALANNAV